MLQFAAQIFVYSCGVIMVVSWLASRFVNKRRFYQSSSLIITFSFDAALHHACANWIISSQLYFPVLEQI